MNAQTYAGMGTEHTLFGVEDGGGRLVLEDGSAWAVYAGFATLSAQWREGEMINVKPSRDAEFPFKLINIHRQESVEARLA